MRTPRPAAGPAFAFEQFGAGALDVMSPRLGLLDGNDPADPLIARQRCKIVPRRAHPRRRGQRFSQIRRHVMYYASGDSWRHCSLLNVYLGTVQLCRIDLAHRFFYHMVVVLGGQGNRMSLRPGGLA